MNKKLKTDLISAFDAPQPIRKSEFLNNLAYPKANNFDFFISQIGYIRKRVWLCSILFFVISLLLLNYYTASPNSVWAVSSALPFLALVTIGEIVRNRFCGMAELESSCKHSLSQVMLIRIIVLGIMNILIFLALLLSLIDKTDFAFFRLGIYLLMPFLINSFTLLFVINHFKGREFIYASAIITGFISISSILLTTEFSLIFTDKYVILWVLAFMLLTLAIATQIMKLIKRMEELEWNLQLTA